MLIRSLSALVIAGACVGLWTAASPAWAQSKAPTVAPMDGREVRDYLMRIHGATSERSFQGTFVVSAGGSVSSARITHYCDGRNQFERIDTMDGQVRHVFRHNQLVHTLWPQTRVALIEQRDAMATFPALLQGGEDRIVDSYEVRSQGVDRVAGHPAEVLHLRPRDEHRYGYRLWSEKSSGLLLRAEVLGARDDVLESSAFSEVTIGIKTQPDAVLKPMKRLEGYRVLRPNLMPTRLDSEGWSLEPPVSGFRQVSCVKRPLLDGADVEGEAASLDTASQVLQSIYSDGLTYVSVFIEPFDASRHTQAMLSSIGATQTLMRRQGDAWVTVVGDVPAATLKRFADALVRK